IVITDTIQLPEEKKIDKIKIMSIAPLLAEAIKRINSYESISGLFEDAK
ncbi:MAG: ribose-phosphate pyrophosphokinase, partial [Anaerococcus porci]|nr:ribose-phosphate pyrophosphokinase [Anaerococcus porci]